MQRVCAVIVLVTFLLVGVVGHLAAYFAYLSQKHPGWKYRTPSAALEAGHWGLTISVILFSVILLVSTFEKRGCCWWFCIILMCVIVFAMYLMYMLVYFLGDIYAGLPEFRTPQEAISALEEARPYHVDYSFYYKAAFTEWSDRGGKSTALVTVPCRTLTQTIITFSGVTTSSIPDIDYARRGAKFFLVEVKGSVKYLPSERADLDAYLEENENCMRDRDYIDIKLVDHYDVHGLPDMFGVSRDRTAPPGISKARALVSGLFFSGATFAYLTAIPVFPATYETLNATAQGLWRGCSSLSACYRV